MTRTSFLDAGSPDQTGGEAPQLPPIDENYFEWVDLLESLANSGVDFTMMERGAGYGRWLVRGAFAARWFGNPSCKLIGVEAEPTHFEWMQQHFRDNGLDPDSQTLLRAAISGRDGTATFIVGNAREWYGQRVVLIEDYWQFVKQRLRRSIFRSLGDSRARRPDDAAMYHLARVRRVSLDSLLRPLRKVDLIDLDVQGAELEVLSAAPEGLNAKVSRVHIGTHNQKVESGLRSLFRRLGWVCSFDFPCGGESETPWGLVKFQDGVQSWQNPKVATQS
jgi:FkbM family methyltransferase